MLHSLRKVLKPSPWSSSNTSKPHCALPGIQWHRTSNSLPGWRSEVILNQCFIRSAVWLNLYSAFGLISVPMLTPWLHQEFRIRAISQCWRESLSCLCFQCPRSLYRILLVHSKLISFAGHKLLYSPYAPAPEGGTRISEPMTSPSDHFETYVWWEWLIQGTRLNLVQKKTL